MTTEQFNDWVDELYVGDSFELRNGDRRMLIMDNDKYALLDPDTGKVRTRWYDDKESLLQGFLSKVQ